MVDSTAVPIAPPICWLVLTIAEPTPASSSGTPAVAVAMAGAKVIPTPRPSTIRGPSTSAAYVDDSVRCCNQRSGSKPRYQLCVGQPCRDSDSCRERQERDTSHQRAVTQVLL